MTAASACRGPEAEGVWASRHAGLGHRTSAPDRGRGRQPLVVERDGRPRAVIAFTGTLYNAAELRSDLGLREAEDAELAAHAYLRWGEGCAARLDGMFAFAVWDVAREEMVLVRDRLGSKPLLYYRTPSGVIFGSETAAVLANPYTEAVLDAEGLCEILTYAGTPGHGVLRDLRKVRPGTVMRFGRGGAVHTTRYWTLPAAEHADDLPTTIRTVRRLIEESVARQRVRPFPVGVMLSGGLDSSALAGLIRRPRTFTVTFTGLEERFTPDSIRATPDGPYVRDVVARVDAEHTDIVLDTADLADPAARWATLRAKELPTPFGDMNISLYLLCRRIAEQVPVVLSGETADSLFTGLSWEKDTGQDEAPLLPWNALARRYGARFALGCGLFDAGLLEKIDLTGYSRARMREALEETPLPDGLSEADRRVRRERHLHLTRFAETQIGHSERTATAAGLEVRMPYADHRLLEYVFATPAEMTSFDGREKSLLRAAVADLIPQSVHDRPKSPYPISIDPGYQAALRDELAKVVESGPVIAPLLDMAKVRALLDRRTELPQDWMTRTDMEMVVALEQWARGYRVTLAL